jgi:hypothetical protein
MLQTIDQEKYNEVCSQLTNEIMAILIIEKMQKNLDEELELK